MERVQIHYLYTILKSLVILVHVPFLGEPDHLHTKVAINWAVVDIRVQNFIGFIKSTMAGGCLFEISPIKQPIRRELGLDIGLAIEIHRSPRREAGTILNFFSRTENSRSDPVPCPLNPSFFPRCSLIQRRDKNPPRFHLDPSRKRDRRWIEKTVMIEKSCGVVYHSR